MQTLTTETSPARNARAPDSFEQFVALRGLALVRFASRLTGDPHRAEDLVQDALAKAYQRWNRIQRMDRPEVYVRRILVNASHAWWKRRSNGEVPSGDTVDRPGHVDVGAEAAERDAIWRAILSLPTRQRAVLVLRYYEDYDDATIADILQCTPVTVRTHAMRALDALRKRGLDK
jgi:RNA polymerase sigma-70 factor (sigma-E family)